MTPAHFTPARQLRGRRARARFVRELLPRPGAALRARHGRTWAPWRRPSAGSPSRDRALGRVSWDLAEGAAARSRPVHRSATAPDARSFRAARLGTLGNPSISEAQDLGGLSAGEAARFGARNPMRSSCTPRPLGRSVLLVRPAWALSSWCKSDREEVIPIEVNRNCGRATDRAKEAGSETAGRCTRTGSEATPSGASGQGTAKLR